MILGKELHEERMRRQPRSTYSAKVGNWMVGVDEIPGLTIGSHVWAESSLPFATWVIDRLRRLSSSSSSSPLRVLEIGSGCGFVGIAVALNLGPDHVHVTLSDRENLDLLRENCARNQVPSACVDVVHFDWSDTSFSRKFDVVIGCEVVYNDNALEPLAEALDRIGAPCVWIAYHERDKRECKFFDAMTKRYGWELRREGTDIVSLNCPSSSHSSSCL
jgi:hypothetical protein